jgi:hypothetical protein
MESFLHGWFPFSKEPEAGLLIGRHLSSFDEDSCHHIQATGFHNRTLVVFWNLGYSLWYGGWYDGTEKGHG